ncbi:MAG: V-type ATPase 116kDa subunit family protein [Methylobacter sp.]|uniref:V-type ATPase 116kDa subunit family protein n=1 Tax=Candidatus Methylobacter titanis TaxID=3053457 RepID=A0AA43THS8_9GAMM|nr:V-type ATPase 116kDa subunit family protein [Candidatus Methylobacter titanis]MDI1292749.1 V-type ATPase 116kDa subunit family protein [Candidatus Methylobacter titanis]
MSIVTMHKVTFIGISADRERLLTDLQDIGCVQIISLASHDAGFTETAPSPGAREALLFLQGCPQRRRQVIDKKRFNAVNVQRQTLAVRNRLRDLEDERDFLLKRIQDIRPWGEFVLPPLQQMGEQRLWFYAVPHKELSRIKASASVWEVIRRDNRFCYVIVVSEDEPLDMPVPRIHLGSKSLHELEVRLDEVEFIIEDVQAERAYLTRWHDLFSHDLNQLQDRAVCESAATQAYTNDAAFALQGWAPEESLATLKDYAQKQAFHFAAEASKPEDNPPTLMRNPSWLAAGEDLVTFYMTPGYRTWDPSSVTFVSFVIFFAMILADAGYAVVLMLGLMSVWKKMGLSYSGRRFRPLMLSVVMASLIFGVMVGSYFGVTPDDASWLGKLHVLEISDTERMMLLSVVIGVFHIVLANVMDAYRSEHWQDKLPSIGWAGVICGGFMLAISGSASAAGWQTPSIALIAIGAVLIVGFTAPREKPLARFVHGLLGLTRLSSALGDVLSYLRLFALGLASGSLAVEFNNMALGVYEGYPGIGLFFALLVLILGHTVNLLLGIISGVIHGLRLNVIEFFNWGLKEEGTLYKPFKKTGE